MRIFVSLCLILTFQLSAESRKAPFLTELAVVFKKKISILEARAILEKLDFPFREGSDSSRGKIYFYKTGPKFIMHIPKDEIGSVKARLEAMPEVYEAYFPDWKIQKD